MAEVITFTPDQVKVSQYDETADDFGAGAEVVEQIRLLTPREPKTATEASVVFTAVTAAPTNSEPKELLFELCE